MMESIQPASGATGSRGPGKALIFAWIVEATAVMLGFVLATIAGIEGSTNGPVSLIIAMLPFVALSMIELTKIPVVMLAFRVHRLHWRLLATVALVFLTAATFENFVFGFERGFNERIRAVEAAEARVSDLQNTLQIAQGRLPELSARKTDIEAQLASLRQDMAASRDQAQSDIAAAQRRDQSRSLDAERQRLGERLSAIDQNRDRAVAAERARCRFPGVTDCHVSATGAAFARDHDGVTRQMNALDERQRAEHESIDSDERAAQQRRDVDLDGKTKAIQALEDDLDHVRHALTYAQTDMLNSHQSVAEATRMRDALIEQSQLHRLSDIAFGTHEQRALQKTKRFFVVSLAAIVAVTGTVVATLHYAARAAEEPQRRPLTNAIRGYLARRRRRLPLLRDIHVAARQRQRLVRSLRAYLARRRRRVVRTIIKEVPIDRLKIIFLPLDATEEQVANSRHEAVREAA